VKLKTRLKLQKFTKRLIASYFFQQATVAPCLFVTVLCNKFLGTISYHGDFQIGVIILMRIMRKAIFTVLLLTVGAFGQTGKPLTQAEFVKMLYAAEQSEAKREELIEAVRKRGIDFELTSGLRGLISTKSRNDENIKRTIEEAVRRKANPIAFAPPNPKEAAEVLAKARENTLAAVNEMPDFVVKQIVSRSYAFAGTGDWKPSDKLTIAVSYSETKGEDYRLLAINGVPQPQTEKSKFDYAQVGGTTSAGEFVTVLKSIFDADSKTDFAAVDTDTLRGRRTIVYQFAVKRENSKQTITAHNLTTQTTVSGVAGKIWVDRENFRVLRVESRATEIEPNFPITAASRNIDYDWVTIGETKYLLPALSEIRLTSRYDRESVESRNLINFRNYQKFGTEVKILDDDVVIEEPKKP
jgi:hypothetical protein